MIWPYKQSWGTVNQNIILIDIVFENYLDYSNDVHYSFNRGLKYTTCGDIDNKGNRYHCPYPYIFNFKNIDTLCTMNNEYCNNVCCTSP